MRITHLRLKNWRNFSNVDVSLQDRVIIVGPNASGKSNLLDALRFLQEVVTNNFQNAVKSRGGFGNINCLASTLHVSDEVTVSVGIGDDDSTAWLMNEESPAKWIYELVFKRAAGSGTKATVKREKVYGDGLLLKRPNQQDREDPGGLLQTHLEQANANKDFREIAEFLSSINYLHVVPQFIRHPERVAVADRDPFGGDLIARIANTEEETRKKRLTIINKALRIVAPQMENLQLVPDSAGRWHLGGRFEHWKSQKSLQDERDFSDGTLRLIGLLWAFLDSRGPVLLEEPELSLHSDAVRQIPAIFSILQMGKPSQVILTTHSREMLQDPGIGPREVIPIQPTARGSIAKTADKLERVHEIMQMDFPIGDAIHPATQADNINDLAAELLPTSIAKETRCTGWDPERAAERSPSLARALPWTG